MGAVDFVGVVAMSLPSRVEVVIKLSDHNPPFGFLHRHHTPPDSTTRSLLLSLSLMSTRVTQLHCRECAPSFLSISVLPSSSSHFLWGSKWFYDGVVGAELMWRGFFFQVRRCLDATSSRSKSAHGPTTTTTTPTTQVDFDYPLSFPLSLGNARILQDKHD